jgi:hypothetical protein
MLNSAYITQDYCLSNFLKKPWIAKPWLENRQKMNFNLRFKGRFILFILPFLLMHYTSIAQHIKVKCSEKDMKNDDGNDPILVHTCYVKNYKFVEANYPDYVGRYFDSEYEVYVRVNNKFHKTVYSKVFNKEQYKLVSIINDRIQKDYKEDLADPRVKECLDGLDSIPKYKMDDFEISFQKDEIWFQVHWGLSGACRSVDGTIITFKITDVEKYFK